jgi:hypothetical protein
MLPEEWQGIRHLLISCVLDEVEVFSSLLKVVNLIYTQLSQASLKLLILSERHYQFYPVQQLIKIESFQPSLSPFESYLQLIDQIKIYSFEAAVVLTPPAQSPFSLAYLCYLANIPIRLGQSLEFGGGVLSYCVQPLPDPCSITQYNLHLLQAAGFPGLDPINTAIA